MTALVDKALEMIRTATQGGGVDREAATRWYQLLQRAKGQDAEQIAYMGEALVVAARGDSERIWVEGLLMGGPKQAKAQQLQLESSMGMPRIDVDDQSEEAAADDGIDWAKVGREAQTMVDLNRSANEAWQGSRKGTKGEEG